MINAHRIWIHAALAACAYLTFLPTAAEAGPCRSGCYQFEVACRFEARAIAESEKAMCVTERLDCKDDCDAAEISCKDGCVDTAASCRQDCQSIERESRRKSCERSCNREIPKCQRKCERGGFRTCDTECRLTRRACVGAAVGSLKDIRPFCEAGNEQCIEACTTTSSRLCSRRCEAKVLRCYKAAKDVKEACFHECFIDDNSAPDCKGQCRFTNVESNDVCTAEMFDCFTACE